MNRNFVEQNDYERYKVMIPVEFLFGKKRRTYINSQLEKLHPCYSDDFCFDEKFSVSRKGICSQVTVINKLKLYEYKARYHGKRLFCKESRLSIFTSQKKKTVWFVIGIFTASLVLVFIMNKRKLIFDFCEKNNESVYENKILNDDTDCFETGNFLKESEVCNCYVLNRCFELIVLNGGKISSLNWKNDGFKETVSFNVKDMYLENFELEDEKLNVMKREISDAVYENEKSSFKVTVIGKQNGLVVRNQDLKEDYRKRIREKVLSIGKIRLVSESFDPYGIVFQFEVWNFEKVKDFFCEFQQEINQEMLFVQELGITENAGEITMRIVFSKDIAACSQDNGVLSVVGENLFVFEKQKKSVQKKKNVEQIQLKKTEQNMQFGKIYHENGKVTFFYKTKEGKIVNESE